MPAYARARRFWITLYDASVGTSIHFPPNVKYAVWRVIKNGEKSNIYGFVMLHEPSTLSALQRYMPDYLLEASSESSKAMRGHVVSMESPYPPFEYGIYRISGVCRKLFNSFGSDKASSTLSCSSSPSPSKVDISDPRSCVGDNNVGIKHDVVELKSDCTSGSTVVSNNVVSNDVGIIVDNKLVNDDLKYSGNPSDMLIGVKACDLPKALDNPDHMSRRDYSYSNKRKSGYRSSLRSKHAVDRPDKFYDPRDRMYTPFRSYCKS